MGEGVHNPADLAEVEAALVVIDDEIEALQNDITDIKAITDALPTLTETGGTVTTDGTEQNVYINSTPLGVFRPLCVKLDCTDHTATETIVLRVYYKMSLPGVFILQDEMTYAGLISPELINIALESNRFGVQVTIEKTAGTNRDYDWEAFYEI